MTKDYTPSPQQQKVYDAVRNGRGNLIVIAKAGAGKTSTIFGSMKINYAMRPNANVAYAAFNVKIRKEAQLKATQNGFEKATIKTANGFGNGAWWMNLTDAGRRAGPDPKKNLKICDTLQIPKQFHGFVSTAVSLAKQRAFGITENENSFPAWVDIVDHFGLLDNLVDEETGQDPEELMADGLRHARAVLEYGRQVARDLYDFDDQVYMPLYTKCRFKQYDWLYVDEAQDTNVLRRLLYRQLIAPGGRVMFVGDPNQAIYGFTGADADSLSIIKSEFHCEEYPLSVCWRCGSDIVGEAQEDVPDIEAAPDAPQGNVCIMWQRDFNAVVKGHKDFMACPGCYSAVPVKEENSGVPTCADCGAVLVGKLELKRDDAILCRNTAPLVEQAFALIRAGVPCHVEGKEIGQGLIKLAKKWTKPRTLDQLRTKLEDYMLSEMKKLIDKGKEPQAEFVKDRIETLFVIMDSLPPGAGIPDLHKKIEGMFSDTEDGKPSPNLTLCTIHKSKGLEWNRVFLLGRNKLMPSKWATKDWEVAQEKNLSYVAKTRAMRELIYMNME